MTDNTYNGWTNYATWNVALWASNDEGLYRMQEEFVSNLDEPVTGEDVRTFYTEYMDAETPDLRSMRLEGEEIGPINYDEIAEHWEEDRE